MEIELLQHQAGPAFVDVAAAVALVHGHARRFGVVHASGDGGAQRREIDAGLAGHGFQQSIRNRRRPGNRRGAVRLRVYRRGARATFLSNSRLTARKLSFRRPSME